MENKRIRAVDRMGEPDRTSLDDQTTPGLEFDSQMRTKAVYIFHFLLLFVSKTSRWPKTINYLHTFIFFALIRYHISEIMLQLKEITLGTGGGIR